MIDVEFRVIDDGQVEAYIELAEHVPEFLDVITNRTVNETGDELLTDFQQEPPASSGSKIEWTSEKQRRFVMAMKRKGLIKSPYERQHRVSKGWRIGVVYTPGQMSGIELWNEEEITSFVEGLFQQKWLAAIGWLNAPALVEKWQRILTDRMETALIQAWYAVGEGVG